MASTDPTRGTDGTGTREAEQARFERREPETERRAAETERRAAETEHREAETEHREAELERREARVERREAEERRRPLRPAEPMEPAEPPPVPPAGGADWRATVATASGINVLAGIWLIIAPFVLGYSNNVYWNDIVFGAIVGILALVRISGAYRESWLSWANMVIGAWIFVSAFWLDGQARAAWNDVILGAIVFFLGLISATASDEQAYADRAWYRR